MLGYNNCGASVPVVADIGCGGYGYNNGGFGGNALEDIIALVVVASIFGFGGRGFGFGGFGGVSGGGCCDGNYATSAEVQRGFDQQATNQRFNAVDNAFAQLGYANQQNAYETRIAIANAQAAQQQCCCDTLRAIDGVNFNTSQGLCNLGHSVTDGFAQASYNAATNTNNIIQSQHADTDRVIAKLDAMETARLQDRIHSLESENTSLKFQASQTAQNAFITANQDAQTAELLRRTGHDCPTAAYVVQPPTPVTFPNFCGCGCGCGNGYAYAA